MPYTPEPEARALEHPVLVCRAASAFGNVYLFAGRRYDNTTGLYYYRNRFYDPRSGRFISRDPLGYADGLNLHAYVRNQAPNFRDPLGLDSPPEELKRFVTYVNDVEEGKADTEIYYRVTATCICRTDGKGATMVVGYSLYYRIRIETRFQGAPEEEGMYGHELRHIKSVEQAVAADRDLQGRIATILKRVYRNADQCRDDLPDKTTNIERLLKGAIQKGVGHDPYPNTAKPEYGKPYAPPGPMETPTSEADFERERTAREARGYKRFIPAAD